jgi:shikimate dehydrogenase
VRIGPATKLFVIVGDPLTNTRVPEFYNPLLESRGIDAVMVPVEVDADGLPDVAAGLKRMRNCAGVVVTMPHKLAMTAFVDEPGETTRIAGAVNVVRRLPDGRWAGDILDGQGYVESLVRRGIEVAGARIHLVGAGGVASAISASAAAAGARAVSLFDVDLGRARDLVARLSVAFPSVELTAVDAIDYSCDILTNATPLGMRDDDPLPCDPERIPATTVVTDVVTKPAMTPLLRAAQVRGCRVVTGQDLSDGEAELVAEYLGMVAP